MLQEEQQDKFKEEKIRIAMEKLREARIKKVSHERLTAHKHFKENSEINEDFWSNSFTLRDDRNMNEKLFAPVFVALFVVGRVGPFN